MASFVTEVLRQARGISHAAHLVLLAIAAYVEEHGAPVYPSQATLATDSGVTERYIEACVQECEAAGYLQVDRRRVPGKRPRNFYTVRDRWRTIPEASSGNELRGTSFGETSSVEKKERKDRRDLQEQPVPRTPIPEPQSPNPVQDSPLVTPAAANWLRTIAQDLGPDFAQVLQGAPPEEPETAPSPSQIPSPADPPAPRAKKPRAPALYFQGKLCPGGHDDGTGHTLRRVSNGNCTECDVERTRAKRQAAAAARNAQRVKPARHVIDLAAHRQRQEG